MGQRIPIRAKGADWANPGDEVWVAKGTYVEHLPFQDTALSGGFAGVETNRGQRAPRANPTVMDGGRSGTCVMMYGATSVLGGFSVLNGHADRASSADTSKAGGIYIEHGTVNNCTASNPVGTDAAGPSGYPPAGGTFSWGGSVLNCVVTHNGGPTGGVYAGNPPTVIAGNVIAFNRVSRDTRVVPYAGGLSADGGQGCILIHNTIVGNRSDAGGGISLQVGRALISNNVVAYNSSGIH